MGKLVSGNHILEFTGEIAIVLLFFMLGLEFSIKRLAGIAKRVWSSGLLDIALSLGISMLVAHWFGLDWATSFLIGGIAYATSSSITVKLLVDKERMANAETEFVLGVLIFEDLVAPMVAAILMALNSGSSFGGKEFIFLVGKIVLLAAIAIILGKTVFRSFEKFLEKVEDEDFKYALLVGLAVVFAGFAIYMGLSEVLGAFLAGVMLAEAGKSESIQNSVSPIRDLLLPVFFIHFGTTIKIGEGVPMVWLLITLLAWSMLAKIFTGAIGGRWYGLPKRVALRAGLSICSRGEFSVVIAAFAVSSIKVFSGIYIVAAAALGMLLFNFAPKITRLIYGQPVKKAKSTQMPY